MRILILFTFVFLALAGRAQSILEQELTIDKTKNLLDFIKKIENKYPVKFYYLPSWIESVSLENDFQSSTIGSALNEFIAGTDLFYRVFDNTSIVIAKDPSQRNEAAYYLLIMPSVNKKKSTVCSSAAKKIQR